MNLKEVQVDQLYRRAGTRIAAPLRVVRVFTAMDGVPHVQLCRSETLRDTITVSASTLLDRNFFRPVSGDDGAAP